MLAIAFTIVKLPLKLWLMLLVAVLLAAVVYFGAHLPDAKPERLTIGYSQEAPYAFVSNGAQLEGVFVSAARQIAQVLQVKQLDWLLIEFFKLIHSVQSQRIDVIGAGITITAERAATLCFAEPLLQAPSALLTLAGNDAALALTDAAPIAVLAGSVEQQQLLSKHKPLRIVATVREGAMAVLDSSAQAFALTKPALLALMQDFPRQFAVVEDETLLPAKHLSAFAFAEHDTRLLFRWNSAQRLLRQQQAFVALSQKSGFSLPELPQDISRSCYAR